MGTTTQPKPRAGTKGKVQERNKSELDYLAEISSKLDRVVAVLAAQGKPREAQLDILAGGGLDSVMIGAVLGITPGAVRTLQSRRRKNSGTSEPTTPADVDQAED